MLLLAATYIILCSFGFLSGHFHDFGGNEVYCPWKPATGRTTLPSFPSNYSAYIEILANNSRTSLTELHLNDSRQLYGLSNVSGGSTRQWIVSLNSNKSWETTGSTCSNSSVSELRDKTNPVLKRNLFLRSNETSPLFISEILSLANESSGGVYELNEIDELDIGKTFYACQELSSPSELREIHIVYSNQSSSGRQIPAEIHVLKYDTISNSTSNETVNVTLIDAQYFVITNFVDSELASMEEKFLMPPVGVYCPEWNVSGSKPFPNISQHFSVNVEYISEEKQSMDNIKLFYDGERKLVSFTYSSASKEPYFEGQQQTAASGHPRIVQDFETGIQYVLDDSATSCVSVGSIPVSSGTAEPDPHHQGDIELKNSSYFLYTLNKLNWTYVGQRTYFNIPAESWIALQEAPGNDDNAKTTYEAYFSLWNITSNYGSTIVNQPIGLIITSSAAVLVENGPVQTIQNYHDFMDYSGKRPVWQEFIVEPCLNSLTESPELLMVQTNTSYEEILRFGRETMETYFRLKLAELANVRYMRIGSVFFYQTFEDSSQTLLFFSILPASGAEAQQSIANISKEISLEEAVKNLYSKLNNASCLVSAMNSSRIELTVEFINGTLQPVSTDFVPQPVKTRIEKGYGGGSMATLGIFMTLIGGALGAGAGYYRWKRQ